MIICFDVSSTQIPKEVCSVFYHAPPLCTYRLSATFAKMKINPTRTKFTLKRGGAVCVLHSVIAVVQNTTDWKVIPKLHEKLEPHERLNHANESSLRRPLSSLPHLDPILQGAEDCMKLEISDGFHQEAQKKHLNLYSFLPIRSMKRILELLAS